jgi:capsular exopolysaccharide synthesis family protein
MLTIVACALIVPAVALGLALRAEKQYSATASLFFQDLHLDPNTTQSSAIAASPDPERQAASNLTLASLRAISVRTARALGIGLTPDQIRSRVTVSASGKSDVAQVTATDGDPRRAARIANTYAREYIAFRRDNDQATLAQPIARLKAQLNSLPQAESTSAQAADLRQRLRYLTTLNDLQTGNAELVQPASVPDHPSSPRPVRDALIGLVLGIFLGIALAFLIDLIDRRLRDEDEIEQIFSLPVLGEVPESRSFRSSGSKGEADPAALEAVRTIYANLRYFNATAPLRSLMITSAHAEEGKTTVSWQLALAAAANGDRVLLVDADLRRATGGPMPRSGRAGLSLVLVGHDLAHNIIPATALHGSESLPPTLDLLPAGPQPPNPQQLLRSARIKSLLAQATDGYDLVIVDTPPIGAVSDAVALVPEVDGLVIVARIGTTRRDRATALAKQLDKLAAPTLGVVINSTSTAPPLYHYATPNTSAGVDWAAMAGRQTAANGAGHEGDQSRSPAAGSVAFVDPEQARSSAEPPPQR